MLEIKQPQLNFLKQLTHWNKSPLNWKNAEHTLLDTSNHCSEPIQNNKREHEKDENQQQNLKSSIDDLKAQKNAKMHGVRTMGSFVRR